MHLPAHTFNVEGSKPVHLLAARLLAAKAAPAVRAVRLFDIALPAERTSNERPINVRLNSAAWSVCLRRQNRAMGQCSIRE